MQLTKENREVGMKNCPENCTVFFTVVQFMPNVQEHWSVSAVLSELHPKKLGSCFIRHFCFTFKSNSL